MADKKISQLTAATTPLAGSEVLPIVQSSTTVKVSVADVTKGRTIQTTGINDNNNNEVITITTTASAVNEITVANAATGANPVISATGSDTNIGITLTPKGTGNAVLTSGNLVVASGAGIDFSATSHPAGMTSELLDDYEEGTWTPALVSTAATFTYPRGQSGKYVKVGRLVTASFYIGADAAGTTSNSCVISGLPFTADSTAQSSCFAWVSAATPIGFSTDSNATTITIWKQNSGTTTATASEVAGGYLVGSVVYIEA